MVEKVLKQPRKNKYLLGISSVFILTMLVLLFTSNVLSLGGTKQIITYGEQQWDMNGEDPSPEWYTTSESIISFAVDLTEDYSQLTEQEKAEAATPFAVTAGYVDGENNFTTNIQETTTPGIYQVDLTLPQEKLETKIVVGIDFTTNNWNINTSDKTFTFIPDHNDPAITSTDLAGVDENLISNGDVTLTVAVEDTHLSWEDVTVTIVEGPNTVPVETVKDGTKEFLFQEDGEYKVTVQAKDLAGRTSVSEPITFFINKASTATQLNIIGADVEGDYTKSKNVNFEIVHPFTVTSSIIKIYDEKGKEIGVLDNISTYTFATDGTYTAEATIEDVTGKLLDPVVSSFIVDTTAPEIIELKRAHTEMAVAEETIALNVNELNFKKQTIIVKNGDKVLPNVTPEMIDANNFTIPLTENGVFDITVEIVDDAGNLTSNKLEGTFTIDNIQPAINLSATPKTGSANSGYYQNGTVKIKITEKNYATNKVTYDVQKKDAAGDYVSVNGIQTMITESEIAELSLPALSEDGSYKVVVTAVDEAGNNNTESFEFKIDETNPIVEINRTNDGNFIDSETVTIRVTEQNFNPNLASVFVNEVKQENVQWNTDSENSDVHLATLNFNSEVGTEDGDYQVNVALKDEAGNDGQGPLVQFTIDDTLPELSITGVEKEYIPQPKELTLTVNDANFDPDATEVEILRDSKLLTKEGSEENLYSGANFVLDGETATLKLSDLTLDGEYQVTLRSVDQAGNKGIDATITFTLDQIDPQVELTREQTGLFVKKEVVTVKVTETNFSEDLVEFTGNGVDRMEKSDWTHDGAVHEITLTFKNNGQTQVDVEVVDLSGRTSANSGESFTVDHTDPVITLSGIQQDAVAKSGNVEVNVDELNFESEKVTFTVTKDGAEYTSYTAGDWVGKDGNQHEAVLTFTEHGNYHVIVNVTDLAENTAAQKEVSFTIDTKDPLLTIEGVEGDGEEIGHFQEATAVLKVTDDNLDLTNTTVEIQYGNEPLKNKDGESLFTGIDFETNGNTATLQIPLAEENSDSSIGSLLNSLTEAVKRLLTGEGEYTITLRSADKAGNDNSGDPVQVSFIIDRSPAEISFTGTTTVDSKEEPFAAKQIVQNAKVTMAIEERNFLSNVVHYDIQKKNADGEYVSENGPQEWKTKGINSEMDLSFKDDGSYRVIVTAKDRAKNPVEESFEFTIDNTDPKLTLGGIVDKSQSEKGKLSVNVDELHYHSNKITLTKTELTTEKNGTAKWTTLPQETLEWKDVTQAFTYDLVEEGIYTFTVTVTDKAGNKDTKSITHTIDKSKAVISILDESKATDLLDNSKNHYGEDVTVRVTVDDLTLDPQNTKLTIEKRNDQNKTEWLPFKESSQFKPVKSGKTDSDLTAVLDSKNGTERFEEGTYRITVATTDKLGHAFTKKIEFTIDKTAPKISIVPKGHDGKEMSANDHIQNGNFTINVDELNGENTDYQVEVKTNQTNLENKTNSFAAGTVAKHAPKVSDYKHDFSIAKIKENNGDYTIVVTAKDKAGNEDLEEFTFTVDNIKPVAKITHPKPKNTFNGKHYYNIQDAQVELGVSVTEFNFDHPNHKVVVTYRKGDKGKVGSKEPLKWETTAKTTKDAYAFEDEGEYVLEVTTFDAAGNVGDTQTTSFVIDKKLPELSISKSVQRENNHYNYDLNNVKFNVVDKYLALNKTKLTITRDGQALKDTGLKALNDSTAEYVHDFKTEGKYVVTFHSTDIAENREDYKTIDFVLDKTKPVVAINGVDDKSFNPAAKNVTVTVDELNYATNTVDFKVTKDGADITDQVEKSDSSWRNKGKTSKLSYNFKDDGLYTIFITAVDKATNKAVSQQKSFTIDKTKPAIDITGVEEGTHYNVDKRVGLTITDVNLDVNKVTVTRDGNSYNVGNFAITTNKYANSTATINHNFSQEGDYEILVEATDKAGNSYERGISFTIDKTKPVITPKMKGTNNVIKDGSFINTVFTPEFALDEAEDTLVSVTLNDGANIAKGVPVASKEMEYTYDVLARDKAGNETTLTVSFTLDTTTPKLSITGVIDGFFNGDITPNVTYSDTHLDEGKTSVTLNGEPFKNGMVLERERDYELKAVITDLADNVASRTIVFRIDKTAPVIKFKEPISDKYFKEDLIPELLIEDLSAYDIIAVTLNGNEYTLGEPINEEGKHVLFFEVKDKAGNIQQLSVEFILDKTPPKVVFEGVEENGKYYTPVSISIRLDSINDKIKQITLNGEEFEGEVVEEDGFMVIRTSLSDINTYEFEVTAYDEAGNEVTTVIPFEIAKKAFYVKFYENKPLFLGTVAGLVAAMAAVVAFTRRKKDEDIAIEE